MTALGMHMPRNSAFLLCMFCHAVHTGVVQSFNSLEKLSNLNGFFQSGKRRETLIVLIWSGKKWQRKSAIWGIKMFRDPVPTYMNAADQAV